MTHEMQTRHPAWICICVYFKSDEKQEMGKVGNPPWFNLVKPFGSVHVCPLWAAGKLRFVCDRSQFILWPCEMVDEMNWESLHDWI